MAPIRVLVMDDHAVFLDAVAVCLAQQPDFMVIGTATQTFVALEVLEKTTCDVVTLDLSVGGEDGLEFARQVLERWPAMGVVIVTGSEDGSQIIDAVQLGVRGWISKTATLSLLLSSLRCVAQGETYLPADLLTGVLASLSVVGPPETARKGIRRLTRRELDVLSCLVEGMVRTDIGTLLEMSPNTVRTHVQSILHKLDVHSALAAVAIARRAGVGGCPEPSQAKDVLAVLRTVGAQRAVSSYVR